MFDINAIHEILPHRYPFLLVDRIESVEACKTAVGYKNVTINEPFFQGHFPEEPVMPGVLIIECIAQVGAFSILYDERYRGSILLFTGIRNAKFRRKVIPGDVLKIEIEIGKIKMNAGLGKGIATVDGQKAVESDFSFFIEKR